MLVPVFDTRHGGRGGGPRPGFDVVVVAASLGGLKAVSELLRHFPERLPVPIVVVQHLPAGEPSALVPLLQRHSKQKVQWVTDGQLLSPNVVSVAPGGRHALLTPSRRILLGEPSTYVAYRAADVLLGSMATHFGPTGLAVVLTGLGSDGMRGCRAVRSLGGTVLVQTPESCVAPSMPLSVIRDHAAHYVLPIPSLASAIVRLTTVTGAAEPLGGRGRTRSA
jgi:two-component system chemotaxis response regulator CheB